MMPRLKQFVPLNCFEFEGLNIGKVTSSGDRDQREDGLILDNNSIKRSKLNLEQHCGKKRRCCVFMYVYYGLAVTK